MRYFYIILSCLLLNACTTVSPNYTEAKEIAYGTDGLQDAGVKGQVIDTKTGAHMILLQSVDRDEYNKDILTYGNTFNPPLTKDFGIIPFKDKYAFRNDSLGYFILMKKYEARDAIKK